MLIGRGRPLEIVATVALILATSVPAVRPRAPFAVAAVFPPWWSAARIAAAAESAGEITGRGAFANIVILYGDAGLVERVGRAGAIVALDPTIPGACRKSQGA